MVNLGRVSRAAAGAEVDRLAAAELGVRVERKLRERSERVA